jgi:NAD(P)H-nitrite reductase large subunit
MPNNYENVGCVCYYVDKEKLIYIIKNNKCEDYSDVKKICKAGSACGMCIPYIQKYIEEEKK